MKLKTYVQRNKLEGKEFFIEGRERFLLVNPQNFSDIMQWFGQLRVVAVDRIENQPDTIFLK